MKQKQAENEPDLVDTLRQWQLVEEGMIRIDRAMEIMAG